MKNVTKFTGKHLFNQGFCKCHGYQWYIENLLKHLTWSVLRFVQNTLCQMFHWVLNTPMRILLVFSNIENTQYTRQYFVYYCSFSSRMVSTWQTFVMKKFMLGCRFNFEPYAKNVREKAAKCSLKTDEIRLDNNVHVLTKFDIYQGRVAPNCFKSH